MKDGLIFNYFLCSDVLRKTWQIFSQYISNSLIYLFISGSVILFKGTVLGPAEIGLLATVGATRVEVIF